MTTTTKFGLILLGGALLASTANASPASAAPVPAAATVFSSAQLIQYTDASQERNQAQIVVEGGVVDGNPAWIVTIDDVRPILTDAGCVHPTASDHTLVVCTLIRDADQDARLLVELGGGDDSADVTSPVAGDVLGEAGNDALRLDRVLSGYGGDGDDLISGAHHALGGRGEDRLLGSTGADTLYGNSGTDEIRGGKGDDWISGGPDGDDLYGNSGNDTIYGGAGLDLISGGPGHDVIHS